MIRRRVYRDADAVAKALADAIVSAFAKAAESGAQTALMLAGGRTPKAAYELVARAGTRIPANMVLMISDERYVPLDHADSNYRMMRPFLDAIGAREQQLVMVNTALPRDEAAKDFGQRLDRYFAEGGTLATCYLGLGADGHTASLFNETHLDMSEGRSAIAVDRPDGRIGISATPSIIRKAMEVIFVVTGSDKQVMAECLLNNPGSITAGKVVWRHPVTALWLDEAACGHPISSRE